MELASEAEEAWLKQWVDEWGKKLLGFAYLYTHDHAQAQDLVQETFFKLFQWHHRYPHRGLTPGWLFRVLSREIASVHRRPSVPLAAFDDKDIKIPESVEPLTKLAVQATLLRLSMRDQECLWLFYYLDWPVDKIADALGVSAETVRGRLFRARQRFKKIWEGAQPTS